MRWSSEGGRARCRPRCGHAAAAYRTWRRAAGGPRRASRCVRLPRPSGARPRTSVFRPSHWRCASSRLRRNRNRCRSRRRNRPGGSSAATARRARTVTPSGCGRQPLPWRARPWSIRRSRRALPNRRRSTSPGRARRGCSRRSRFGDRARTADALPGSSLLLRSLGNNGYDVTVIHMANSPHRACQDLPAPGSPAWWATRPPRRTSGRGRPPRSFERIVEAASELVDEVGSSVFSMRLLAERLETSTATLYRHVAGKEELMAYLVDHLFAELEIAYELTDRRPRTWRRAARRASVEFHRALSEHPNLLPLLVSQIPIGPHGLAVREGSISMLVRFGFSPRLAARAYTTLAHYVIGFSVQQYAPGAPGDEE